MITPKTQFDKMLWRVIVMAIICLVIALEVCHVMRTQEPDTSLPPPLPKSPPPYTLRYKVVTDHGEFTCRNYIWETAGSPTQLQYHLWLYNWSDEAYSNYYAQLVTECPQYLINDDKHRQEFIEQHLADFRRSVTNKCADVTCTYYVLTQNTNDYEHYR